MFWILELELNREDYNNEHYWTYWTIYSIKSLTLNIQFGFRKNNPNDAAQVLTGNIEHFVDDRLVSSE